MLSILQSNNITKTSDYTSLPVSYTHLDVYKRQGLHSGMYGELWLTDVRLPKQRIM